MGKSDMSVCCFMDGGEVICFGVGGAGLALFSRGQ